MDTKKIIAYIYDVDTLQVLIKLEGKFETILEYYKDQFQKDHITCRVALTFTLQNLKGIKLIPDFRSDDSDYCNHYEDLKEVDTNMYEKPKHLKERDKQLKAEVIAVLDKY